MEQLNHGDDLNPASTNGRKRPSGLKGGDAFVMAMAVGMSVPQASERAGISFNTGYRRMEDPEVKEAIDKARGDILTQAVAKLVSASCKAIDALVANLESESSVVRHNAAVAILGNMLQGMTLIEVSRRLERLEEIG
jgi:hypothetical protein